MTSCPPREQLHQLLNDLLDDAEEQRLDHHLHSCAQCRQILEELTAITSDSLQTYAMRPLALAIRSERSAGIDADAVGILSRRVAAKLHAQSGKINYIHDGDALPDVPGYEVIGLLGRGGMGIVYKAVQAGLGRTVALKTIRAGKAAEASARQRFRREIQAVARLQHPNIVQIFEVGEAEGVPFFSMEFVDGRSLADNLAGVRQAPRHAAEVIETLARAVHFAHEQGILHRDLKPANILLTTSGAPKIADFGLAKLFDGSIEEATAHTTAGTLIQGTPCYMAPEQAGPGAAGRKAGAATDVYALGGILYEMLTGQPPFEAATPLDTVLQVLHSEPTPPRRFDLSVPRDLETICLKCLAKEPERRYRAAADLADDLRRFLAGEPIRARPVSTAERLRRWCARNPIVASLLAALALVLVTGFSLVTWKWRDEVQAAHNARQEKVAADGARREAERLAARLIVDQAINHGDHEQIDRAMLLLAQGLELATKADDTNLERAIRLNLDAWRRQLIRRRALLPHEDWVWNVVYSPDGELCATASRDRTVKLWRTADGHPLATLTHAYPVWSIAFSPDARRLLTGSGDLESNQGELRLWDVTGESKTAPAILRDRFIALVMFNRTGNRVLTVGEGGAKLMRIEATGLTADAAISLAHPEGATTAAFSPEGSLIVTGGLDGTARLWQAHDGSPLAAVLDHNDATKEADARTAVVAVAFSPDGARLITGTRVIDPVRKRFLPSEARLWDVKTTALIGTPWPQAGPVKTLVFSRDGRFALTAGIAQDLTAADASTRPALHGEARLWDVSTGKQLGSTLKQPKPIWSADFNPDGQIMITGNEAGDVQFWTTATCLPLGPPLRNYHGNVNSVSFSPDGRTALSSRTYEQASASLWEAPQSAASIVPTLHAPHASAAVRSPDGKLLATADLSGKTVLWSLPQGEPTGKPLVYDQGVLALAFSPKSDLLAVAYSDDTVQLWNVAAQTHAGMPLMHDANPISLQFSHDGRRLVVGTSQAETWMWDVTSRQFLSASKAHTSWVRSLALSPDGATFVAGADDGSVRWFDVATHQQRGNTMRHHPDSVSTVAFTSDGKTLLTASRDQTAWLWDVATGTPRTSLLQHDGPLTSACLANDGRLLLTGSEQTLRLWDTATGLRIGPLLPHPTNVLAVFTTDAVRLGTLADDGYFRTWDMPAPAAGDCQQIRTWVEDLTQKELAGKGIMQTLARKVHKQ